MLFKKRTHIEFLITGHPRGGNASSALVCQSVNVDVKGEAVGKNGISSWMLAVDDKWSPYGDDTLGRSRRNLSWDWHILVVRDLNTAVPSVMIENKYAEQSFLYRRKHILRKFDYDLAVSGDEITAAVLSIIFWTKIILEQSPALAFRIEDEQYKLKEFVLRTLGMDDRSAEDIHANAQKSYDGTKHTKPILSRHDWHNLSNRIKLEVDWYCNRFQYPHPLA